MPTLSNNGNLLWMEKLYIKISVKTINAEGRLSDYSSPSIYIATKSEYYWIVRLEEKPGSQDGAVQVPDIVHHSM